MKAMIHSKNAIGEIEILSQNGKEYIVRTEDGVKCTAIFNPFTGIYYADDKYGRIE